LGLIVLVLLMLFGATRLADLGGSLGKGIKEFRKNVKEEEEEPEAPAASAAASKPSAGPEMISALKCPNCGNLNPANARLCNQCGTSLQTEVGEKSPVT
jgi:sec-independent protein translocase protein TatA